MDLDKIALEIVRQSENGKIQYKYVDNTSDNYNLSLIDFSKLCDLLSEIGITIVDEKDLVNQFGNDSNNMTINDILIKFQTLSDIEKKECYSLINSMMNPESADNNIKKTIFLKRVAGMNLQYSYMAVFIKAFFYKNRSSSVDLQGIINYYRTYYSQRTQNGLKAEKNNSIFEKGTYTDKDIKRHILFNPMGRSFLSSFLCRSNYSGGISFIEYSSYVEAEHRAINDFLDLNPHSALLYCDDNELDELTDKYPADTDLYVAVN